MSGAWTGLTWDELDRLADYTAGVLSGAEADEVARLIHTDDRWAAAHAELLAAQPAVSAALQAAAETPVTMPAEVAARLDAALADAVLADAVLADAALADTTLADTRPDRRSGGRPSRPHGSHPHATRPPDRRPHRARRRMPTLMRVAAGVLLFAALGGLGTLVIRGLPNGLSATDAGAMSAPGNESAESPVVATDAGPRIIASGTDYSTASLPDLAYQEMAAEPKPPGALDVDMNRLMVEDSLAEVATPDGLARCLGVLQRHYSGVVTVVDFARFEGEPAVVVVVQDGTTTTVVALGAACGTDGLLNELASVPVR